MNRRGFIASILGVLAFPRVFGWIKSEPRGPVPGLPGHEYIIRGKTMTIRPYAGTVRGWRVPEELWDDMVTAELEQHAAETGIPYEAYR